MDAVDGIAGHDVADARGGADRAGGAGAADAAARDTGAAHEVARGADDLDAGVAGLAGAADLAIGHRRGAGDVGADEVAADQVARGDAVDVGLDEHAIVAVAGDEVAADDVVGGLGAGVVAIDAIDEDAVEAVGSCLRAAGVGADVVAGDGVVERARVRTWSAPMSTPLALKPLMTRPLMVAPVANGPPVP